MSPLKYRHEIMSLHTRLYPQGGGGVVGQIQLTNHILLSIIILKNGVSFGLTIYYYIEEWS